jgi:hypothetical protein
MNALLEKQTVESEKRREWSTTRGVACLFSEALQARLIDQVGWP